jgi:hypothetical protein
MCQAIDAHEVKWAGRAAMALVLQSTMARCEPLATKRSQLSPQVQPATRNQPGPETQILVAFWYCRAEQFDSCYLNGADWHTRQ